MDEIAVIDYGMGNLRSVAKALEHVAPPRTRVRVTSDPDAVRRAARVVFPGQGAARDCMRALKEKRLDEVVRTAAVNRPFLGVCMGMQVLMDHSDENDGVDCLGVFPGQVRYFRDSFDQRAMRDHLKIPHMGWNTVHQSKTHPLWAGVGQDSYFYFVHSYYVAPVAVDLSAGITGYGIDFASAIAQDNVFALQCHPEKSAASGLRLLANFSTWNGHV